MKIVNKFFFLFILLSATMWTSCEIEEIPNPNETSLEDILQNATPNELQTLVTGVESLLGQELSFYIDVTSIVGRDYWYFTGSDPRYTGELLGRENSQLDNAGFYGTRPYFGRYRTIKNCNILLEAVANAAPGLTTEDVAGYNGFAKTIQAYEYLLALNLQYQNGIRIDVADPDNLGAFESFEESLRAISNLLTDANSNLSSAGDAFRFSLSPGFAGFETPVSFTQFNRAIAARVALYQGDMPAARAALGQSFMDMGGSKDMGPAIYFSTAGGEASNPVFRATNQADAIIAHPSFVDAVSGTGDARASKVALRDAPLTLDGLTGDHDVVIYTSLGDNIPMIRNEELWLTMAEAQIGNDNGAAENALNAVRSANGLDAYSGGTTDVDLVTELVQQRWLSLWGEGHRWVDMRRWGMLDQLPLDRDGDDVWEQMPRPVSEN